jgi:hypothetical protein
MAGLIHILAVVVLALLGFASVEKIGTHDWVVKYYFGLGGYSVFWALLYSVWRAQNYQKKVWRAVAFLGGLPITLLSYFVVAEASDRAYGIELPRQKRS